MPQLSAHLHSSLAIPSQDPLNFSGFEDEELCGLGKALVRELRSTRVAWFRKASDAEHWHTNHAEEKKLSIPQLAKKPRVLRPLNSKTGLQSMVARAL